MLKTAAMIYPIEEYKTLLMERLTEKRYFHSLGVMKEAVRLAKKYGADVEKARVVGLLHDITKDMPAGQQLKYIRENGIIMDKISAPSPKLWHAITGAHLIRVQLGITDEDMLNAVRYHTTARAGMSLLEKTLYLADYTSEDRDYNGVEDMRRDVEVSMEKAMHTAQQFSICDLCERDLTIHPDTIDAWNELVAKQ